jgi:hypothetical protein
MHFLDVLFDLAGGHATRIKRNHSLIEVADRALALGYDLRFEAAVAITRGFDVDLAEITPHRFAAGAIT